PLVEVLLEETGESGLPHMRVSTVHVLDRRPVLVDAVYREAAVGKHRSKRLTDMSQPDHENASVVWRRLFAHLSPGGDSRAPPNHALHPSTMSPVPRNPSPRIECGTASPAPGDTVPETTR